MLNGEKSPAHALQVANVTKNYPGVCALDDVTLEVKFAQVHGIIGENGAGKSTLMKTISGAIRHDDGSIRLNGIELPNGDPHRAAQAGIAMVYQELTIVPAMSALGNVLLGRLPTRVGFVSRRIARVEFARVAEAVESSIDPDSLAGELSTAEQQLLEIMRALSSDRKVIILDEPTASLGPQEIRRLHQVIRNIRMQGKTFIYVSHDLDAVLDICDVVTVMREGKVVNSAPSSAWTKDDLIRAMLGKVTIPKGSAADKTVVATDVLLEIEGLTAPGVDVPKLTLHTGEIIGLAGLVGSGRTRFLQTLAGLQRATTGTLLVRHQSARWPRTVRQALQYGIAMAPEDRKLQGLVLRQSGAWNMAMGQFRTASNGRVTTHQQLLKWAYKHATRLSLKPERLATTVSTLSGGNQQKVILGRLLARGANCVLLDEPTRGIDIGAKAQIFETLREMANSGLSIIWTSSEIEEVLTHSDRVIVLAGGHAVAELPRGSSVHDVLRHSFAPRTSPGVLEASL